MSGLHAQRGNYLMKEEALCGVEAQTTPRAHREGICSELALARVSRAQPRRHGGARRAHRDRGLWASLNGGCGPGAGRPVSLIWGARLALSNRVRREVQSGEALVVH